MNVKYKVIIMREIIVEADDEMEAIDEAEKEFFNQFDQYVGEVGLEELFDIKVVREE